MGLHLLPFYPSSSDDGFAVIDYHRVDPAFGDWNDMIRLGASFGSLFPDLSARVQKLGGADKVATSLAEGQRDKR